MTANERPLITIAIDGYSSSGKSTMAKKLARQIGYRYIDSGAMYRAVALYALRHGMITRDDSVNADALQKALPDIRIDFSLEDGAQHTILNGEDVEKEIRTMEVSRVVSPVAALPAVRRALVRMQQELGASKGIVMDGRDIGTTVFPDAEMKVFVKASAATRAQRRLDELTARGEKATFEEVLENVEQRDHIDETREESPLRCAEDASVLDNSFMTRAQQDEWIMNLYNKTLSSL